MLEKNIRLSDKVILVTGTAGFVGANLVVSLLKSNERIQIIGVDNLSDYYDVALKESRLHQIEDASREVPGAFVFIKGDIADKKLIFEIFDTYKPDIVVNLAAQAGVRYSIVNPDAYIEANVIGFYNILEACRHSYDEGKAGVAHLVFASSSSIYGSNKKIPYCTEDKTENPVSLYAATKKSDELFAHVYAKLYGIPCTGLRFFTVYGPAGRPDMAYFSFTDKLLAGDKIKIFNYGDCKRDFTYIDDIVTGVTEVMQRSPLPNKDGVRYKIYNIGNNHPENLLYFVEVLQRELVRAGMLPKEYDFEAYKELVGMQPGDVEVTYADVSELENDVGFKPQTPLDEGLRRFVDWYKEYYHLRSV